MFLIIGIVSMVTVTMPTSAQVVKSFQVKCDFGLPQFVSNNKFVTEGTLTRHFGNARTCKVTHNVNSAIVRVWLSRLNHNISVIYTVVMEHLEISFVGTAHYHDVMLGEGYHFHACPVASEHQETTQLSLFLFGTPIDSSFQFGVDLDDTYLSSGQTKSISVQKNGLAQVVAFDVLGDDLFKLLQISISSDEDATVCYLVVSRSCTEVQRQGIGITSQGIREKELKLTFTRFGRITLSQFSSPKIQTGRWYIGVLVKEGKVGSTDKKIVNITITQSYNYDSIGKGLPALYIIIITSVLGLVIAVFAHFYLNSDFDQMKPPFYLEDNQDQSEGTSRERFPTQTIVDFIPQPIPRNRFPFKRWVQVVFVYWFGKGMKTFSYLTAVLAISFMVGSAQFVIGRWSNMITSGDRDTCYYNERCYRPIAFADIPSNFMISNIPYVIHGCILALSFSFREAVTLDFFKPRRRLNISDNHLCVPYDYSLAYALAWALIFEGLFSATYHLCPSRLTFQFDSAFMFIISGLVVVALYNSRIKKAVDTSVDEASYEDLPPDKSIIQAPKYFLFFVAPLLVLNYVGSIRDTTGLPPFVEVVYWVALAIWLVVMYIWAFRKIGVPCRRDVRTVCSTAEGKLKWFWVLLFPVCIFLIGISKIGDWSQFFLFSCVAAVALSILGLITLDLTISVKRFRHRTSYDSMDGVARLLNPKTLCLSLIRNAHRVVFIVVLFLFWVFAMYFFKLKPTAKKTAAPSVSRTYNSECVLWDFFDYHDIWHMLSSFALFMSAYLLIYITRKVEKYYWVETNYWQHQQRYTSTQNEPINIMENLATRELRRSNGGNGNGYSDKADVLPKEKGKESRENAKGGAGQDSQGGARQGGVETVSLDLGFKDFKKGTHHWREAYV